MKKYFPDKPCRPEDGFHKCRSIVEHPSISGLKFSVGDEICVLRLKVEKYCGEKLRCTDDEIECRRKNTDKRFRLLISQHQ